MKKSTLIVGLCLLFTMMAGCSEPAVDVKPIPADDSVIRKETKNVMIEDILDEDMDVIDLGQFNQKPTEWGEKVTGVKTRIKTDEKKIALTFDACGGEYGSGYDEELVSYLKEENVHATLFINERWIRANEELFIELALDPLFQIENHGTNHSPLSVSGGEAWGIEATSSPEEAYDEIIINHETVRELLGKEMTLFRSGTAYYDEVSVQLAKELGYEVVNFDILGDAGATFSSEQVKRALLDAKEGSIALMHMNQPSSGTAEGVKQSIPLLREKGFEFVLLENELLE